MATKKLYDALILGSGPGGLAVALGLARQTYTTAVFDSGVYRNARATHMHNVLGFDHVPPADFRNKARSDLLARYETTTFADVAVDRLTRVENEGGTGVVFRAVDADGHTWHGRTVVLAVGVEDLSPPDIEGFSDCWGRGVFHCLFCHGYEERGVESVGILALGMLSNLEHAIKFAHFAKPMAKSVRLYAHGNTEAAEQLSEQASKAGFLLETRRIKAMRMNGKDHEVVVTFEDGTEITEGFIGNSPSYKVNGNFTEQLGLETIATGEIKVNFFGETNVPGVFAVGDCANPMKNVPNSAADGSKCAAGVALKLAMEPAPVID